MALAIQVPGPALVRINAGEGLEDLGYSINGVEVTPEVFMSDVPGDQNGGDEGPPIDVQYFGETARVRMDLSKWDSAVADKVFARLSTKVGGAIGTPGSLIAAGSHSFRLLILPTSAPMNFLLAFPRAPIETNKGTKFARLTVEWECHAVSGVLWNVTTT